MLCNFYKKFSGSTAQFTVKPSGGVSRQNFPACSTTWNDAALPLT